MNEKDMFLQTWEREFGTTLKVLNAYPADKLNVKPHERSRSAKELLWVFVTEEKVIAGGVVKGQIDFTNMPKAPDTKEEIVSAYRAAHVEMVAKVKNLSEKEWDSAIPFMVAPKKVSQVRRADILWTMVMDSVHHRGQLSVYLRLAGATVPSIYGPTADEPWM